MTDHLPECPLEVHKGEDLWDDPLFGFPCWCPSIRACEQRVRDELPPNGADATWYLLGQRKGVQAARDAVAALHYVNEMRNDTVHEALAAIDALRGDRNE